MDKPEKKALVAVLGKNLELIGSREKADGVPIGPNEVDEDPGDLPLDGTYKWVPAEKSFFPLGHGFPPISTRSPITEGQLLRMLVESCLKGEKLPPICKEWADWYDQNLKAREEEGSLRLKKMKRGG